MNVNHTHKQHFSRMQGIIYIIEQFNYAPGYRSEIREECILIKMFERPIFDGGMSVLPDIRSIELSHKVDICQRTIPKGRCGKTPLVAMPIIGEPLARVAIDLVGPLPMSGRKHRWILTLVDCATRYPEAIPMKGIDTIECAE